MKKQLKFIIKKFILNTLNNGARIQAIIFSIIFIFLVCISNLQMNNKVYTFIIFIFAQVIACLFEFVYHSSYYDYWEYLILYRIKNHNFISMKNVNLNESNLNNIIYNDFNSIYNFAINKNWSQIEIKTHSLYAYHILKNIAYLTEEEIQKILLSHEEKKVEQKDIILEHVKSIEIKNLGKKQNLAQLFQHDYNLLRSNDVLLINKENLNKKSLKILRNKNIKEIYRKVSTYKIVLTFES